ncbi:MAG: hypothetical protein A3D28_01685 [Omnitrophica bacterium RIFCSPHIGHO2_02_FULL_63_14]|nr:MAG: hypothetical protein A3D28_01685 [Omnitrophica bacterium RIFCSPHIGHO2_02_FULL_63_14]
MLFVNPPSVPYTHLVKGLSNRFSFMDQIIAMPMGILYLSAVLRRDWPGCDIRIIDLAKAVREYNNHPQRRAFNLEEFTTWVLQEQIPAEFVPDFVGISILFSTAHKSSMHIAKALKGRWPESPIIMGGMHATNAVQPLLAFPEIDYVCRGEGESVISYFAKATVDRQPVDRIQGIFGREKLEHNTEAASCESAPLINNLDEIPFPAWDLIPMPEYVFANYSRAKRIDAIAQDGEATIVTTRGCPFHCTFCASWTVHGRTMRYRSIENVVEEVRILLEEYHINSVIPEDDLFSVKKPRVIALCEAIAARFGKSIHFQFPNGLSVATLDEDVINAMVKMGMRLANIAIESGSAYVQHHVIKKDCNLERARRVVQACRDTGIIVRAYFVLGFPGETREMMQETVDFAASLPTDWNIFSIAAPLIGTEMHSQMLEAGWIDQTFNWDDAFFQERTFDTPAIRGQELKDLAYTANMQTNFFQNYNMRTGQYDRALALYNDVLRAYEGHLVARYCSAQAHKGKGDMEKYEQTIAECREMLEKEYPLSRLQLKQYAHLMPELGDLEPSVAAPEVAAKGPRPGMPYKARLNT